MVNPIPEGTHTITPHLVVRGGDRAIEFYKQAFGAVETTRMQGPDGSIMHAELRIGDSPLYLADENPAWGAISPLALGGSPVSIHLYVHDVDAAFDRAIQAGATVRMPLSDAFWGDRYGQVGDPFGHIWSVATHKEDVSSEEMERRVRESFASMPAGDSGSSSEPESAPEPQPEPTGGEVPRRSAPRPAARPKTPRRKTAARKKVAKKKVAKKKVAKKKVAKKKVAKKKVAARKKTATRKKTAARKKTARRKTAAKRKTPARRKVAKKKTARRAARKKTARKATRKKTAKRASRRKPARRTSKK
jgi:uncharacterized glyoxalase superfamily protein PhnB